MPHRPGDLPDSGRPGQAGLPVEGIRGAPQAVHIRHFLILADIQLQVTAGGVEVFAGAGGDEEQGEVRIPGIFSQSQATVLGQGFLQLFRLIRRGFSVLAEALHIDSFSFQPFPGQGQHALVL